MKLLTKENINKLPALYSQKKNNHIVHSKFFTPDAGWTWHILEGTIQEDGGRHRTLNSLMAPHSSLT